MLEKRRVTALVQDRGALSQSTHPAHTVPAAPVSAPNPANALMIAWRRRYIVLVCLVLGVVGGIIYLKRSSPVYLSSSRIHVQQNTPRIMNEGLGMPGSGQNYLWTQCDVIRSTAILAAAIQSRDVRGCKTLSKLDNPVGFIKAGMEATVGKQSDIISVSLEAPDPEDAALIVNHIVNAYIDYQTRQLRSTAAEVLKILQKEKEKHETELRKTNAAMLAFRTANSMLAFESDKGNIIIQRLQELSNAMTDTQLEALDAKVAMDAAEAVAADATKLKELLGAQDLANGQSTTNDDIQLWMELRRLRRSAQDAEIRLGSANPVVAQIKRQLVEMERELTELDAMKLERFRAAAKQRWVNAEKKEQGLRQALDAQRALAMDLNSKSAEFNQLETDARRAEKVLDLLDSRIKEINVTEEAPVSINVLEVARPAGIPIRPNPAKIMQLALLLGLLAGVGGAFLVDRLDQRLRSTDEIAEVLRLPILGVIPHIEGKRLAKDRGQEVHRFPRSNVAEAYRTVRTSIYFGSSDGEGKTLLVTSPAPGDGKTTMASNLAIAMAQAGRRVLLIDADCRRPMQHNVFGIPAETGISSVLLKRASIRESVQSTQIENLFIMPCGPLPTNPAEMLNSQDFIDLLNELTMAYDQVIVDSPPVMPVTDARILAASCDATLLVVRADKSTRRISAGAVDALTAVGAKVLGVVVNDVARGKHAYYYGGYHYSGYYGHANGQDDKNGGASRTSAKAIESAT